MQGTVFTGHPTLTTLGNTLRTICYAKYVSFKSNIRMNMMAAGDDCVVFVKTNKAE